LQQVAPVASSGHAPHVDGCDPNNLNGVVVHEFGAFSDVAANFTAEYGRLSACRWSDGDDDIRMDDATVR
jgi:hypothetical protein